MASLSNSKWQNRKERPNREIGFAICTWHLLFFWLSSNIFELLGTTQLIDK